MPRRIDKSASKTRIIFNPQPNNTQSTSTSSNGLNLKVDAEPVLAVNAGVGNLVKSLLEENALNSKDRMPSDDLIVYDDPVLNARYEALSNFGINPLRSEIIAISEFIPIVSEAGGENSAKINLNIGQQTKVSVSNVSRLIELHRQIREYVTNSASKVIETIYGEKSSQGFLNYIKAATANNLNEAVDKFSFGVQQTSRDRLTVKNVISEIIKAINEGYINPSDDDSLTYVEVVKNSAIEDYYLQGLVEYFIYEIIILDVIKYLGTIAFLDERFKAVWGVDNYLKEKPFNANTAFSDSSIANSFNNETFLNDPNAAKNIFFYDRHANSSDYDALLNLQAHLISLIKHTDSITYLESLEGKNVKNLRQPGEVKIGLSGDLGRQINKVKRLNQVSLTNGSDEYVRLGVERNFVFNDSSDLFDFYKGKIKDFNGNSPNRTKQVAEVLSAMAFDNITFKNDFKITREGGSGLSNLAESIPKNGEIANGKKHYILNSLLTYLSIMTNIKSYLIPAEPDSANFNKSQNTNDGIPVFDYFKFGHGVLSKTTSPVLPISDTNPRLVIPLESTNNETIDGFESVGYMPGPDYFFKEQISLGNGDFDQLESFASNYKSTIQKFTSDIFKLLPDSSVNSGDYDPLSYQIKVLKEFANKDIPRMRLKENMPVLASLLNSHNTTTKRDALQAIYWTFVGSSRHDTFRDSRKDENFSRENKSPAKQLRKLGKDLIERNCESSTYNFLKGIFGEMTTGTKMYAGSDWDGEAFDGQFGVRYKTWMAAFGNPYVGSEFRDANLDNYDINEIASELPFSANKTLSIERNDVDNVFASSFSGVTGEDLKDQCDGNEKIEKSAIPGYAKLIKSSLDIVGEVYRNDESANGYLSQNWSNPSDCHINNYTSYFGNFRDDKLGFGSLENFGDATALTAAGLVSGAILVTQLGTATTIAAAISAFSSGATGIGGVTAAVAGAFAAAPVAAVALALGFIIGLIAGLSELFEYYSKMEWADYPLAHGGIHQFSAPQRITYWYYWVNLLLINSISVKASTIPHSNNVRKDKDKFVLKIDTNQFDGVKKGILDAITEIEDDINVNQPTNVSNSFLASYEVAKLQTLELLQTIKKRQQYIRDCVGLMAGHADAINASASTAKRAVNGIDEQNSRSSKRKLTQTVLSGEDLNLQKILPLSTNQTVLTTYQSYINDYRRYNNTLFPLDMKYSLVKNKLMYKVLSTPGYGFLPTEKRGNKSIINVGLPSSMIASLRTKAFDETKDTNFLNSPYVAISIYKKDHLNDKINLLPKVFIFDTSAEILDYKSSLESTSLSLSNHLSSFNGDSSFNQILSTIEITRAGPLDSGDIVRQLSTGYPEGIFSKDVLINHVFDYVLKEYMRASTGININPKSFILQEQDVNFNKVNPSNGTGQGLVREFEGLITEIQRRYPETISDPQLASEVFRLVRVLKNTVPFNIDNRLRKVLYPSAFDKTYSIFINEKDFVFSEGNTPNNLRIFKDNSIPNYSITSKISRPQMAPFTDNLINVPFSNAFPQKIKKYAIGSGENFPEVYNYYSVVSILPIDFVEGADLKFNSTPSSMPSVSQGKKVSDSVRQTLVKNRNRSTGLNNNKNTGWKNSRSRGR